MKALCWHGFHDVRHDTVPDPTIQVTTDAIIKVTACAICGSDLHLTDGYVPSMKAGDVMGHETMGEVVEVGSAVAKLKIGDRVVVPFTISCGSCWFCQHELFSLCDRSNPSAEMQRKEIGQATAGLFGYSHMYGGFAGGQAEYLRVPYADVGPIKVGSGLSDAQVLFLSDIFPTAWMAAENAGIKGGETVAIWGCGPVGQLAIRSAMLMGAARVIAMDEVPERLKMARASGAEVIDFKAVDGKVYDKLMDMTQGRGPDACIDAVGTEAAGHGAADAVLDKVKAAVYLATDRAHVLRDIIQCVRKGGTLSVPGVYIAAVDKFPMGAFVAKALTMKSGQTHVQRYLPRLLKLIEDGKIDPSFVVTHERPLAEGPELYTTFREKKDGCMSCFVRDRCRHKKGVDTVSVEMIGWASSSILIATLMRQVYTQWKTQAIAGVSKWLFIGQLAASTGYLIYSFLLRNWVFLSSNIAILCTALLGEALYLRNRRLKVRRESREGVTAASA